MPSYRTVQAHPPMLITIDLAAIRDPYRWGWAVRLREQKRIAALPIWSRYGFGRTRKVRG